MSGLEGTKFFHDGIDIPRVRALGSEKREYTH